MYREKINEFIKVISKTPDSDFLDIIEDLVQSAGNYVMRVADLEAAIVVAKETKEASEYREYIESLDKKRSSAHNVLIANTKAVNRMCKKYNVPLLFEGNEEARIEIVNFAQQLIDELFSTRRL
jgi:Mg2+ and Co2+ transporter CorA